MDTLYEDFSQNPLPGNVDQDYNLLMRTMQVSVSKHLLNEQFTMIWGNDFYYKLIGYPRGEYKVKFHNRPDLYYQHHHYEAELKQINTAVVEALQAGRSSYSIITRMPVKGGGHVWVRMSGIFTEEQCNGVRIAFTVITDVHDLVEMRQAQSITYNNIPGFVAKYLMQDHLQIKLLEANDQFAAFFGVRENRVSSDPLFRLNLDMNRDAILSQLGHVEKGEHVRFLAKLQNSAGKQVWMQVNGDCVDWIDHCPVYQLLYIDVTDLTELQEMQKKLEAQTQQLRDALASAQKANEAKRAFLSRMSHEIRTPMNAIIGMTSIAAAHLGDDARIEDCLQKITFASRHLLSLINDILDMSKIEDGKLDTSREPFRMQQVLESVATIIYPQADAQGIAFKVTVHDLMEQNLVGDAMRVSQILLNLLSNAVKFTPKGGKAQLEVGQCANHGDSVTLRFLVSDTGRGMSEEFLERLYQPFEQENTAVSAQFGGTGLGMAITKNLITLLGGVISVHSRVNEGTVFTVELPFELSQRQRPEPYLSMEALKVLIGDDDPDHCAYTALLLSKFGIQAHWVLSGGEAVEEIRRAHNAQTDYDICLLDWKMPDLDGIETTRTIRSLTGPTPIIILMTAYNYSDMEETARAAGANFFLTKPFFASSLYNTLLAATGAGAQTAKALTMDRLEETTELAGFQLLLVEDNALNREIGMEFLQTAGAAVTCVTDGQEAVEWFLSPAGRSCDAILMDIQMPRMDGYQATKAIRAAVCPNAREIPIVAMTADAFQEDAAAALEAGMNAHIPKPIDVGMLYRTLKSLVKKKP